MFKTKLFKKAMVYVCAATVTLGSLGASGSVPVYAAGNPEVEIGDVNQYVRVLQERLIGTWL